MENHGYSPKPQSFGPMPGDRTWPPPLVEQSVRLVYGCPGVRPCTIRDSRDSEAGWLCSPGGGGLPMISCSPWNDGFELVYGDRCLFRHSSKSPGLFFSRAAVSTSNSKLKFPLLWKGFGPCAISPKAAECLLSFPGGVTARLEFSGRSVGMRFSSLPGDGKALGLRFPSARGERFFGLGPSAELRLRGGTSYYLLPDSENRRKKFPTVFSSRNWWCAAKTSPRGRRGTLGGIALTFASRESRGKLSSALEKIPGQRWNPSPPG